VSLVLALLLWQSPPVRVGDTVWVETAIRLPGRMIVRPQPWDLGDLGQVLGPPEVRLGTDSATIRYPLVLWYPGDHELSIPGPIVVAPEGSSDTLPSRSVKIAVASVLPSGEDRGRLDPKPSAVAIRQSGRSPVALLWFESLVALAGLAGWLVIRRRRRRRRASVVVPDPVAPPIDEVLSRWVRASELKAAVDGWAHRLEAGTSADDPTVRAWLAEAELAGFRPDAVRADLERLLARLDELPRQAGGAT